VSAENAKKMVLQVTYYSMYLKLTWISSGCEYCPIRLT